MMSTIASKITCIVFVSVVFSLNACSVSFAEEQRVATVNEVRISVEYSTTKLRGGDFMYVQVTKQNITNSDIMIGGCYYRDLFTAKTEIAHRYLFGQRPCPCCGGGVESLTKLAPGEKLVSIYSLNLFYGRRGHDGYDSEKGEYLEPWKPFDPTQTGATCDIVAEFTTWPAGRTRHKGWNEDDYFLELHQSIELGQPVITLDELYRAVEKRAEYLERIALVPPPFESTPYLGRYVFLAAAKRLNVKVEDAVTNSLQERRRYLAIPFTMAYDLPQDTAVSRAAKISLAFDEYYAKQDQASIKQLEQLLDQCPPIERSRRIECIQKLLSTTHQIKNQKAIPFQPWLKLFPQSQTVKKITVSDHEYYLVSTPIKR